MSIPMRYEDEQQPQPSSVCVTDYINRPYAQICELLERSARHAVLSHEPTRKSFVLGDLTRVSRSVARLSLRGAGTEKHIAELRILTVRSGRDPVTEFLLVAPGSSSMDRERQVHEARELLDVVVRHIDTAASTAASSSEQRLAS